MPTTRSSERFNRKRIVVLIDPGDSWGRGIIRGISSAVRHLLPWDLLIAPRDDQWRLRVPRSWTGDGLIGAIRDDKTADHVCSLELPTVNVSSWEKTRPGWYRVQTDDRRRAEMAFEHFRDRGFRHFAYYGPPSLRYSDHRGRLFHDVVTSAGFPCEIFRIPSSRRGWHSLQEQTQVWLENAPRPLAIFAADPHPGIQLTEICNAAGFLVPEEIAILAGDTDDLLCNVSDPLLSSIVLASERIGMASVRVLETLLRGEEPPLTTEFIPPLYVIEQQSSEMLAVDDPVFHAALRFIRERAHTGIQVGDILRMSSVSRRSLEQRFQKILGRTPADEIRRIKLDRVKQLLIATEQTVEQIAQSSGFCGPAQLCFAFKKEVGQTPLGFRQSSRHDEAREHWPTNKTY
ncbi:MAG TPA: DNA-binding transcriptional regulator [Planctomicrobium sp.]|nr:DNA-binding transcriptional regulator [Planctomicrobium sp.]